MKTKINKYYYILFLSLTLTFFSPITVNAVTITSATPIQFNNSSADISPCAEDIRWVYKTIGNQLYRRQFNYTRNVWIGNWEPC